MMVQGNKLHASDESTRELFDVALAATLDIAVRKRIRWLQGAGVSAVEGLECARA
jgi:hypothetical protein